MRGSEDTHCTVQYPSLGLVHRIQRILGDDSLIVSGLGETIPPRIVVVERAVGFMLALQRVGVRGHAAIVGEETFRF